MYYVYVLKSKKYNWFYVGITDNITRRLREHNDGRAKSTKFRRPYQVIYLKDCKDRISARKLEKYLKSGSGKEKIKNFYNNYYCARSSAG